MSDPANIAGELTAEQKRTLHEAKAERRAAIRNRVGAVVLGLALAWSFLHVAWHSLFKTVAVVGGDKVVIRFAHWQLEGRTVDALNLACKEYMKLHPGVVVEQIDVPERGYEPWVKTQLIGRTAPDFIELRTWSWKDLMSKYFVPLAAYVDRPNPYNQGTVVDGESWDDKPWRETFRDNMEGGWIDDLQAQYGIPLTIYTMRIYANRQVLERALGHPLEKDDQGRIKGPGSISEFLEWCEAVKQIRVDPDDETSDFMVPISGSDYVTNMFSWKYWDMATWGLLDELDRNHDGNLSESERMEPILRGGFDITKDPHVRAGHEVLFDISRYFTTGFMSAKRDESVLWFTLGRAAMIASGSWDAGSLKQYIGEDFDLVIFDFPTADPADPKYGEYLQHRLSEAGTRAGFTMGLTKLSQNRDEAIDFMMFLTSKRVENAGKGILDEGRVMDNETLNEKFYWFPAIKGCEPREVLIPFTPQVDGVLNGRFKPHFGGDTERLYNNARSKYMTALDPKPDHYENFIKGYNESLLEYGVADIEKTFKKQYGSFASNERSLSSARVRAFLAGRDDHFEGETATFYAILLTNQTSRICNLPSQSRKLKEMKALQEKVQEKEGGK